MTDSVWFLMCAMAASFAAVLVLFLPPANRVFENHPECSVAVFHPDLTQKQRKFCREWNKQ
jgi:hypothetical protein